MNSITGDQPAVDVLVNVVADAVLEGVQPPNVPPVYVTVPMYPEAQAQKPALDPPV